MPRMNILSTSEKDEFDTPPILNSRQRKQFFDMPENYQDDIQKLRSPTNKIASVLVTRYLDFFSDHQIYTTPENKLRL